MSRRSISGSVCLALWSLSIVSCSDRAPLAPTGEASAMLASESLQSRLGARPIQGECTTTITFLPPGVEGQCVAFRPVPSAFIAINGECTISHLGRTDVAAIQQLVFLLDSNGMPVLGPGGQPVVSGLRNCSTFTAANGDLLEHTTTGDVEPAGPTDVRFSGPITFVGGTGRFAGATGSATFTGTASLTTNTGAFSFGGTVAY